MNKTELKKLLWQKHTEAHRVHHKIADFVLLKDTRDHPPGLRNLVKKYLAMMEEYEGISCDGKVVTTPRRSRDALARKD